MEINKIEKGELYCHYHHVITREAEKFIEKVLKSDNLKRLAVEIACLNVDYVMNHINSDNDYTKKHIQEILKYGFKKSTMGLLLHMR